MITAGQFKKGTVITHDGVHWVVEDYHIHKTAQRRPVLQTKLRSLKTGHVVERAFDEADRPSIRRIRNSVPSLRPQRDRVGPAR
jgi:translation elongation factor P/translation initiation factor 5A